MNERDHDGLEPMVVTPAFLKELNALLELGQEKLSHRLEKLEDSLSKQEKDFLKFESEAGFKLKGLEVKLLEASKSFESDKIAVLKAISDLQATVRKIIDDQPEKVQKLTQSKLAVVAFIVTCISVSVPSIIWLASMILSKLGGGGP